MSRYCRYKLLLIRLQILLRFLLLLCLHLFSSGTAPHERQQLQSPVCGVQVPGFFFNDRLIDKLNSDEQSRVDVQVENVIELTYLKGQCFDCFR
ncbi:hypothetical protein M378DRAFT_172191 [Amanita muscaria Koide BX008]|uniref:Uncharacterized protein n=1 Tax=Amanita muscaria (strain Koide BX008) TaxID=946122 RepID=A0A0C2SSP5_AMAMK|nr:hypothetical protein M378DRAFT_172191 [Amanita muscaria Koide BX008]